jgi:hypothetical protein
MIQNQLALGLAFAQPMASEAAWWSDSEWNVDVTAFQSLLAIYVFNKPPKISREWWLIH